MNGNAWIGEWYLNKTDNTICEVLHDYDELSLSNPRNYDDGLLGKDNFLTWHNSYYSPDDHSYSDLEEWVIEQLEDLLDTQDLLQKVFEGYFSNYKIVEKELSLNGDENGEKETREILMYKSYDGSWRETEYDVSDILNGISDSIYEWNENEYWESSYFSEYDIWDELKEEKECLSLLEEHGYYILPIHMFEHSQVHYSTSPFNDRWDSSNNIGIIYTTDDRLKELGVTISKDEIYKQLEQEVIDFDNYQRDGVLELHIIEDLGNGIDSYSNPYYDSESLYKYENLDSMVYLGSDLTIDQARGKVMQHLVLEEYPELKAINDEYFLNEVCSSIYLYEYTDDIVYDEESLNLYSKTDKEFNDDAIRWSAGLIRFEELLDGFGIKSPEDDLIQE